MSGFKFDPSRAHGVDTDGFSLEAQLPVALGTPTVEFLDDVLGPL